MSDFNIGDKVFHKSNSTIAWVIEKIEKNEAFCSTVLKDTFKQVREKFTLTSLEKCGEPRIIVGHSKNKFRY